MTDKNRRNFMAVMGATTVAVPLSALVGALPSHADDMPMVDVDSPEAKNWEYVATSTVADNQCNNCVLYQGEADAAGGGCPLFPGKQVASEGWCKAWAAKPQ